MAYLERYNFTFNETIDRRNPTNLNDYEVKILEKDYTGESEEILAVENPVQINYNNSSEKIFEPLNGSEVTLNLIATEEFQLEDLYTEDELRWLVEVYRNNSIIWRGFIIPDGCQESFTFTPYTISVNAVDTLGLLKNLAYVQNSGDFWLGKQSFIQVIYNCLNRVNLPNINIYTCVNLYEDTYPTTDASDPLALTYVNAERFLNEDGVDPMNCDEVLKNVMHLWTAKIVQSEGDWYVYRPSELFFSGTQKFRKYVNGVFDSVVTKNVNQLLGGESEGLLLAPLFHTDTDQLKMIEKPYKNFSMSYTYGENKILEQRLANPNLTGAFQECGVPGSGPCDLTTIPDWTKNGTMYNDIYPSGGVVFYDELPVDLDNYYQNNNTFTLEPNFRIRITINYKNIDPDLISDINFQVIVQDDLTRYDLYADGTFLPETPYVIPRNTEPVATGSFTFESQPWPNQNPGTVTFRILSPSKVGRPVVLTKIEAFVFQDLGDVIGQTHSANQKGNFSFAPETIKVLNGDSALKQYMGAMYRTDQSTLTTLWKRKYATESALAEPSATKKPLLRLAVEEVQRMYARPFVKFDGTIFGYFNPLSRFTINDLEGLFVPLQLSYDLQANKVKTTLARINDTEIEQEYELKPDYGTTTKVLVK